MDSAFLGGFLESTVRTAVPLALVALGETLTERAGIINVGAEGAMIAGALGAALAAALAGAAAGLVGGVVAGMVIAVVFAVWVVCLRADQIITGTAITLGTLGLTSALYRVVFGTAGAALTIPTLEPITIPGFSTLPIVGTVLFRQPVTTYLAIVASVGATWLLFHTPAGLAWRAVGESPAAAHSAGASPDRIRFAAITLGGAFSGLAGASLVVTQVGTFAEGMTAGRGFIAISIVALGRWHPLGALCAAFIFGAASAAQYVFQSLGLQLPYQLFLALPYVFALVALTGGVGRSRAPGFLGRALQKEDLL